MCLRCDAFDRLDLYIEDDILDLHAVIRDACRLALFEFNIPKEKWIDGVAKIWDEAAEAKRKALS